MNKLDVQQTGGFPMETDTLDFIQTAYDLMNALGFISGANTIISGCNTVGGTVSDGVVFYQGEVLEFKGGAVQAQVRIFQDSESREFESGETKIVYKKRWMGFGSSGGNIQWSSFTRPKSTKELTADMAAFNSIPVGAIMMWAGTTPPAKWALCNGANGTPDLRSRFVVGYNPGEGDYDAIGKTGGAKTVTLTEAQMPAHNHLANTNHAGAHTHALPKPVPSPGGSLSNNLSNSNNIGHSNVTATSSGGGHSHSINMQDTGGDQAHENRPPYYTLAFIQFKG